MKIAIEKLGRAERITLSRVQRLLRKKEGVKNIVDRDVLAELVRGIIQGYSERGTFYRVMDIEEFEKLKKTRDLCGSAYKFVNRDKRVNAEIYGGYEGQMQVEIRGEAVPYDSGEAEGEMLLYNVESFRPIKGFMSRGDIDELESLSEAELEEELGLLGCQF